jgi:hypothetical protein
MLHKYKNDSAPLDINIVPGNESGKAPRSLPTQNKILCGVTRNLRNKRQKYRLN